MLEWDTATESARAETGDKAFRAGTVLTKKEYYCKSHSVNSRHHEIQKLNSRTTFK